MKRWTFIVLSISLLGLALSGCAGSGQAGSGLSATGTISADVVAIAPEMGGKVLRVDVQEGQAVSAGDVLLAQDTALLEAQRDQAQAQTAVADAAVQAAEAQLASARAQYNLMLQGARQQDRQARTAAWQAEAGSDADLPAWYFQKAEDLAAAQAEEDAAAAALEKEQANLAIVLKDASNDDFVAAEQRLAQADQTYQVLSSALEQARAARDNADVEKAAQDRLDQAKADLDAARLDYKRMLTSAAAADVREARARVAVAQARLDYAREVTAGLQTGDQSLQVQASQAGVQQAEAAVAQARAAQAQAGAALKMIELQIAKAEVKAPLSGTVLARNVEPGELAAAGSTVMTIGRLDQVRLTVYVPEDQYGAIRLEQAVSVSADSYPGRSFSGKVVKIADQAEFTPRNVSTAEGRKSTVYAVEILLPNPDQALKPGMPAEVVFAK